MKKLIAVVFVSIVLMALLVILAFLYVDLSGHKGFIYDLFMDGKPSGSVKVDRYVTEGQVIYKSKAEYPYTLGYPDITEELFLKKGNRTFRKFIREEKGVRGQKQLTLFVRDGKNYNYLFLDPPRFIAVKGAAVTAGEVIFSPGDMMLYMVAMEKYNFWKRGAQFFEVLIPADAPVPPLNNKIEVRYLGDEYIPVMGRKIETESFAVGAKDLPEAKVFVSKYAHRLLAVEIEENGMRFILSGFIESPGKRFETVINKIIRSRRDKPAENAAPAVTEKQEDNDAEEIFFKSGNLLLSGRIWSPPGQGPFPAALFVPKDGPMEQGQQCLLESLGEFLSASGFIFLTFDSSGQGKSQGDFLELDDEKRIGNITAAVSCLEGNPKVNKEAVTLIGYRSGGYLALKAASDLPSVQACVCLGAPPVKDYQQYQDGIMRSTENFSFFMGIRMPVKGYREFLSRDPYETILSFEKPLLLILGRDDKDFNAQAIDTLKRSLKEKNDTGKIAVFRNLGEYMGRMVIHNDFWEFLPNQDILNLIKDWMMKNGVAVSGEAVDANV